MVVSENEINSQIRELGTRFPLANDLDRARRRGAIDTRDALYFLLLDVLEQKRRHAGPHWSASRESVGV